MTPTVAAEVERFLRTGEADVHHPAWPGRTVIERAVAAHRDLRGALAAEVASRTSRMPARPDPAPAELVAFTRRKVEPMVRGLFPRAEQEIVLALVERSVVVLTPGNIADLLTSVSYDSTAWQLANLYLYGAGAELLGPEAPEILGMSEGTTCYLTTAYLDSEWGPFEDFLVHEVAHVFHNCKRQTVALPHTRRREWLLPVAYRRRETFAYSCEAYAWVVERASKPADRAALAATFEGLGNGDDRVDPDEVADIVRQACRKRNGWKEILARCAEPTVGRSRPVARDRP